MPFKPMVPNGNVKQEDELMSPHLWELKSLPAYASKLMSTHLNPRDLVEQGFRQEQSATCSIKAPISTTTQTHVGLGSESIVVKKELSSLQQQASLYSPIPGSVNLIFILKIQLTVWHKFQGSQNSQYLHD